MANNRLSYYYETLYNYLSDYKNSIVNNYNESTAKPFIYIQIGDEQYDVEKDIQGRDVFAVGDCDFEIISGIEVKKDTKNDGLIREKTFRQIDLIEILIRNQTLPIPFTFNNNNIDYYTVNIDCISIEENQHAFDTETGLIRIAGNIHFSITYLT